MTILSYGEERTFHVFTHFFCIFSSFMHVFTLLSAKQGHADLREGDRNVNSLHLR